MTTFICSLRRAAPLLACVLGLWPAPALADGPAIHLWGFQRGCQRLPEMDKQVEKKLFHEGKNIGLLAAPDGGSLPACMGEDCAKAFRAACSTAKGRLLGGQVVQSKDLIKVRLWLYDLGTGQTAYQDDFCQSCNLISALTNQARALVDNPQFGAAPDAKPSYCANPPAPVPAASGPVFLNVSGGSERQQKALTSTLKAQFEALERPLYVGMAAQAASGPNARTLGAEIQKDGKVLVSMADARDQRDARTVECRGCDFEALATQVKQAVADLLDRCLGAQCAAALMAAPPVGACDAFSSEVCTSSALDALFHPAAPAALTGRYIDPGSAKLLLGLSWGATAATLATGALLRGLSGTAAGDYRDRNGVLISNHLDAPGYAVLGVGIGLLLGVAVPTTVWVKSASTRPSSAESSSSAQSLLRCPL